MYQIEKLQENKFYIKATGTFPPPIAEQFVREFNDLTKNANDDLGVIIDITDAILLKFDSIEIILDLLKRNNNKLYRSAFVIAHNPPLSKEFRYILEKADSPKRKIVSSLDEAKKWIGVKEIHIKKEE
ncbi:MAG: hypothetical protein ACTSV5_05235 [Promethearchaeota archaeon]